MIALRTHFRMTLASIVALGSLLGLFSGCGGDNPSGMSGTIEMPPKNTAPTDTKDLGKTKPASAQN